MAATFGQWLRQQRKVLDLTQEALASQVGCSAVTIKKIEADQRRPSAQIAELLARHLRIPASEQAAFIQFARMGIQSLPPATREKPQPAHNLPTPPTPLIGRENDLERTARLLSRETTRLLTLAGPPGVGKTRLSLALARDVLDEFADGVFFVPLAPISDPALVPAAIASLFQLQEVGPQTPLERLKAYLRDKQLLLVLDNFEQILAAAPQIADLVAACGWIKIVVTSRAPLRIRSERQYAVQPLALPDLTALPASGSLTDYPAISLFVERAQAVKQDFAVTEGNSATVAAICTRLDGLPLAIELVSARVKLLPPSALLERLAGRLMLYSDGLRDIEARHKTLNAAIDWSYHLLNPDEQTLFRRLGIFVGGCTLEAIESVCNPPMPVLDGVASLLDKSLLRQETDANGEPRFIMLETIREYGLEKLRESGEVEAIQQARADHFLALAEEAEPELKRANQYYWFKRLEQDHENLRAVMNWAVANNHVNLGLKLVSALDWFWVAHFHHVEGLAWAEKLLKQNPPPSLEKARTLQTVTCLAMGVGDFTRGIALEEEALPILRKFNVQAAFAHGLIGSCRWYRGEFAQATETLNEGLLLSRQSHDQWQEAFVLYCLSLFYQFTPSHRDLDRVAELVNEGLRLVRHIGDRCLTNWLLNHAALLAQQQCRFELSKALLDESLTIAEQIHDSRMIANAYKGLGKAAFLQGDYPQAAAFYRKSLLLCREMSISGGIVENILGFAELALATAQWSRAARLLAAMQPYGNLSLLLPLDPTFIQRSQMMLSSKMDDATFNALWAEGRAMTIEQTVSYALAE